MMRSKLETVGVVGMGYVGLTTAVCFAARGIPTIGIDVDEQKLTMIASGKPPFYERGLTPLLRRTLRTRHLEITKDYQRLRSAGIIFITVNTPSNRNGSINLSSVKSAASSIGRAIREQAGHKIVVVKSTAVPGTTENLVGPIVERESHKKRDEFGLAANPEFLREGLAVEDTMKASKLIIGTREQESGRRLVSFYKGFYGKLPGTIITTPTNAELIKYASNAFLATKISFINEIANFCAKLPGADVKTVAEGMGLDRRIAPYFLSGGLGFGGSCFGKDVRAILNQAASKGSRMQIAKAALEVNSRQPLVAVELAKRNLGNLKGKRIAVLGLSFKPGTDDMREAVSIPIVRALFKEGAYVVAYDPAAIENARRIFKDEIQFSRTAKECLVDADCCLVVTEWPEFSKLRPVHFKEAMRTPTVIDGRRVLNGDLFLESRVRFAAVGLGPRAR